MALTARLRASEDHAARFRSAHTAARRPGAANRQAPVVRTIRKRAAPESIFS